MIKLNDLSRKTLEYGKKHIIDTTALLSSTNPFYGLLEKTAYGMSNETSINARINIAKMSYLGLGLIFAKGRDLSRKLFHVNDKTKESLQTTHDGLYSAAFNAGLGPILYTLSGSQDWKEITVATLGNMVLAFPTGIIAGYTIDAARDLTGIKESKRIPKSLRNINPNLKKTIAAGLVGASLGLMALIYSFIPDKITQQNSTQQSEYKGETSLDSILQENNQANKQNERNK